MKIEWISWERLPDSGLKAFGKMFASFRPAELIANVDTEFRLIKTASGHYFPVTINTEEWENAFVCSPYTAYALYSKDELTRKISSKWVQLPMLFLIKIISRFLRAGAINKNIHVNNYMLSTNPYPEWNAEYLEELTAFLRTEYPDHAIVFRSLNRYQHSGLMRTFAGCGYDFIGSRQVYMYDLSREKWLEHNNNRQDTRIIKKMELVRVGHQEMEPYLDAALGLYNQLYLEKYSRHNPQFTSAYFKQCHAEGIIHFQGYIDENKTLKAFAGLFILHDTITSPLVGYDTREPIKKGLYIHAIRLIMDYKFESGLLLNLSSGASAFKRLRGGVPSMEYSAVFTRHLSKRRQLTWKIITFVSNKIGVPLIEKYEL